MAALMVKIETPDRLKEAIKTLSAEGVNALSESLGRSSSYISTCLNLGRMQKGSFNELARILGITPEKLMEYAQEPKPEEQQEEEPNDNEVLNMLTLIYEMEKRQVEALQKLNGMFERTWCK